MASGFLNFEIPRPGFLDFGRAGSPENHVAIDSVLPSLSGVMLFRPTRRVEKAVSVPWQARAALTATWRFSDQSAWATDRSAAVLWNTTTPWMRHNGVAWNARTATQFAAAVPWRASPPAVSAAAIAWAAGSPESGQFAVPFQQAHGATLAPALPWNAAQPVGHDFSIAFHAAVAAEFRLSAVYAVAAPAFCAPLIVWQQAMPPPHGWRPPPVPPVPAVRNACRLNFVRYRPDRLDFRVCYGSGQLLVPVRRSYIVFNTGALIRVSDSADIPCVSLTIATDWDSWGWRLSATLAGRQAYDTVPAAPALVRATLNGFSWDFISDDPPSYERTFGRLSATLAGLGPAAVMITPYAASRTYRETSTMTAAQLALQEMPFGWSLDWGIVDWTVPGGQLQYDNLTPLEAIIRIVKSAGGRLYADQQSKTLYVRPRWPQKPWDWYSFAPDVSLPSAYTLKETGQSQGGSAFEAVLISGGVGGMAALVKRAGTGGLTYAPTATDALVTDIAAAQARAVQVLADGWPLKHYTLDLPLQAQPEGAGLILPGTTLDFVDGEDGWRGLVTGCSIRAEFGKTIQTLELVSP